MKTEINQYHEQAEQFLAKFGIKFRAILSNSKSAPWKTELKQGNHYLVTLSKLENSGVHGKDCDCVNCTDEILFTFDFWGSIADREKRITELQCYDVLACISSDVSCPDTFKDFCAEYGYDSDSIKALGMFKQCHAFSVKLKRFFTSEQIEALQEIQ